LKFGDGNLDGTKTQIVVIVLGYLPTLVASHLNYIIIVQGMNVNNNFKHGLTFWLINIIMHYIVTKFLF
jgi:hypothetical protein